MVNICLNYYQWTRHHDNRNHSMDLKWEQTPKMTFRNVEQYFVQDTQQSYSWRHPHGFGISILFHHTQWFGFFSIESQRRVQEPGLHGGPHESRCTMSHVTKVENSQAHGPYGINSKHRFVALFSLQCLKFTKLFFGQQWEFYMNKMWE